MLFIAYLLYGMTRPLLSQSWRREIESDLEEEEEETSP